MNKMENNSHDLVNKGRESNAGNIEAQKEANLIIRNLLDDRCKISLFSKSVESEKLNEVLEMNVLKLRVEYPGFARSEGPPKTATIFVYVPKEFKSASEKEEYEKSSGNTQEYIDEDAYIEDREQYREELPSTKAEIFSDKGIAIFEGKEDQKKFRQIITKILEHKGSEVNPNALKNFWESGLKNAQIDVGYYDDLIILEETRSEKPKGNPYSSSNVINGYIVDIYEDIKEISNKRLRSLILYVKNKVEYMSLY